MRSRSASRFNWLAVAGVLIYGISGYTIHRFGVEAGLDVLARFGPRCPVFSFTGWKCGFCGMSRAFVHLLDGRVESAVQLNLLSVPVFIAIPGMMMWWVLRRPVDFRLHPLVPLVLLVLLALYSLVRNLVPGVP